MTTELLDAPEPQEEEVSENVLIEGSVTQEVYEHENEDVRSLDELLRNVAMRNSVYAHEILDHLPDNPYSEYVYTELSKHVAHIPDGDKLLHSREYLDMLLDYRNVLTVGDTETTKE